MALRVLIVNDEPIVRRLVQAILEHAGFAVIQASDGSEALALFKERAGQIELLLTDLVMPGMSGIELVNRARAINADLPILFMSGYCDKFVELMNGFECISGSEQESEKGAILRCFAENKEFSLERRQSLRLQQQVTEILASSRAA